METGIVYNIQRFCNHDGPGLRTVVFLKGCPLRCKWCCNPESQSQYPELMHNPINCLKCGECISCCSQKSLTLTSTGLSIDRQTCNTCGICATQCCCGALQIIGKNYTTDEIVSMVLKDQEFFTNSGGGVTFSGGEPLRQSSFVLEILEKLTRLGVHTAIETAGAVAWEHFERVIPFVGVFLYDLKHIEDSAHREGTKAGNKLPLENLKKLALRHKDIIVRVPLIPDFNMDEKSILNIGLFVKEQGLKTIHLLPYHRLGQNKYKNLGKIFELEETLPPSQEQVDTISKMLQTKLKLTVIVDG
ncbi:MULTISPECIES: glycyl-radical enzyme activating protein [Desulfosporosinus]|uniref:Pyruvate formate lyase activating enzyme n=1 Tax=Desulfosporosinus lacus DSM 15449 TaxID=1121420 RepID=A0A1M5QI77_9FIRM|nr:MULTISPECIES: glycyl-radical enzyme activating protein [Desulfosporosinus]KJR48432.1 Pyruvate formate-lyase activating enzyme [Desulfosporosinus sp. I2]SHH13638.1 pyruvate formate lyase activating enzyme [Desulfosporosinus lacus DSM 15449]